MESPVEWTVHRSHGIAFVGHCSGPRDTKPKVQKPAKIKVVAIDLNQTLIVSKSGTLHGLDENDWKWWHESVPIKLGALASDGYTVIISSNQGRLTDLEGAEVPEAASFKRKLTSILQGLQIPVTLIVACANDIYRKPRPGLWPIISMLTGHDGCDVDREASIIIGDAAGRELDFSDSDLHWALNAGIPFFTPEEFFLDHKAQPRTHKFHPCWYLENSPERHNRLYNEVLSSLDSAKIIVLVGLPGAGKTTLYRKFLQGRGFKRYDARSYENQLSFVQAANQAIEEKVPVVIDDLNIDITSREPWVRLARRHELALVVLHLTAPPDLCGHNDTVRALGGLEMNPERRPIFPRPQFLSLVAQFQPPKLDEGFHVIHDLPFKWSGTENELSIWQRFWL